MLYKLDKIYRENTNNISFIKNLYHLTFYELPIKCFICEFDLNLYSDTMAIKQLGPDLYQKISNAVISRKAEFLAGRLLAKHTLNTLGFSDVKVDIGSNRMPIWPENIKGSISHTEQTVICAVSLNNNLKRIGVDIELLKNNITFDLIRTIMDVDEEALAKKNKLNKLQYFALFFSAKESLFKAIFPEVKQYFGFDVVKVIDINVNEQKISLSLNCNLNSIHNKGKIYTGSYIFLENHIITILSSGYT